MADKKVNLRFKPKGTEGLPVQPIEIDQPGIRGTLPFMPGAALTHDSNVPEQVRQAGRQIVEAPVEIPDDVRRQNAQMLAGQRKVVSLDELPPERQTEVLSAIKQAAALPPPPLPQQQMSPPPKFIPSGPGIGQAKAMAERVAAQQEEKMRQRQEEQVQQQQQSQQRANPRMAQPPQPPQPVQQEYQQEEPQQQYDPPQPAVQPVNCIHCGWPVDKMDMCNPDQLDKQVFVAAVLGQKRFSKEYGLLGNQLKVVFRSLTVEENDLVVKQLMYDWNNGKITGPAHSVVEATKYQLALALESIEKSVGVITLPTFDQYDDEPPPEGQTILPKIVEYVNANALQNEPTRRIIAKAYGHFIDTQAKLEAMAEQSDFWLATGE